MTRADPHFKTRLPEPLRERIRNSAQKNRRSMTSEIVVLLERALPPESDRADSSTQPTGETA